MKLETRLKREIQNNPDKYSQENFERVLIVAKYVDTKNKKYVPYRFLNDAVDFHLFYNIHPGWRDLSTTEMQKDKEIGTFYGRVCKQARIESKGDSILQKKFMMTVFPQITEGWDAYKTLDDWIIYFSIRPELKGKTTSEIHRNPELNGDSAYTKCRKWIKETSGGDEGLRKEMMKKVFAHVYIDWSKYTTVEDWKTHHDSILRWSEKSARFIRRDKKNNGNKFHQAFLYWAHKESGGDKEYFKQLREKVFS